MARSHSPPLCQEGYGNFDAGHGGAPGPRKPRAAKGQEGRPGLLPLRPDPDGYAPVWPRLISASSCRPLPPRLSRAVPPAQALCRPGSAADPAELPPGLIGSAGSAQEGRGWVIPRVLASVGDSGRRCSGLGLRGLPGQKGSETRNLLLTLAQQASNGGQAATMVGSPQTQCASDGKANLSPHSIEQRGNLSPF